MDAGAEGGDHQEPGRAAGAGGGGAGGPGAGARGAGGPGVQHRGHLLSGPPRHPPPHLGLVHAGIQGEHGQCCQQQERYFYILSLQTFITLLFIRCLQRANYFEQYQSTDRSLGDTLPSP